MSSVETIKRILNSLNNADWREFNKSESTFTDKEWTRKALGKIADAGNKAGYSVYGARTADRNTDVDGGEFLYDLTWLEYDIDEWLRRVPLVLECEWSRKAEDIYSDFEKLLLSKANLRVMIFNASQEKIIDEYFNDMKKYIRRFSHGSNHDRYLLCGWHEDGGVFKYLELPD